MLTASSFPLRSEMVPLLGTRGIWACCCWAASLIELFLLQHLELKHPPDDQGKTEEEETREEEDSDLEPIDRFSFHRMTIT